jgi:hypothetical protein
MQGDRKFGDYQYAAKGPALQGWGWIAGPHSGHFRFFVLQKEEESTLPEGTPLS